MTTQGPDGEGIVLDAAQLEALLAKTFNVGIDAGRGKEPVALVRLRLSKALLGAARRRRSCRNHSPLSMACPRGESLRHRCHREPRSQLEGAAEALPLCPLDGQTVTVRWPMSRRSNWAKVAITCAIISPWASRCPRPSRGRRDPTPSRRLRSISQAKSSRDRLSRRPPDRRLLGLQAVAGDRLLLGGHPHVGHNLARVRHAASSGHWGTSPSTKRVRSMAQWDGRARHGCCARPAG